MNQALKKSAFNLSRLYPQLQVGFGVVCYILHLLLRCY